MRLARLEITFFHFFLLPEIHELWHSVLSTHQTFINSIAQLMSVMAWQLTHVNINIFWPCFLIWTL